MADSMPSLHAGISIKMPPSPTWSFKQIIELQMCQGVSLYLAQDTRPLRKTMAIDMEKHSTGSIYVH
jgi:hypothetical protein